MQKDERDLLEVLKFELDFLKKGGYGRSTREPWRPRYIFEDSPTCMNYDCKENPEPCSHCVLIQLVPPDLRNEKIPCRHIPLNKLGENLDSQYRYDDQREVEENVGNWLRATIASIEETRRAEQSEVHTHPAPSGDMIKGTPLFHEAQPKCSNPACPTEFHWLRGGKFFRFLGTVPRETLNPTAAKAPNIAQRVKHFWLCERCSHVFTMAYHEESGVVLKLLWPDLPVAVARKELTAAHRN